MACRLAPDSMESRQTEAFSLMSDRAQLRHWALIPLRRFYDRARNVVVYVSYSDRVLAGSPKNSISSVPIMGWVAP